MNIENAINRLQWRFKNNNIKVNESKIIINQTDIEAVDFLIIWVNKQKEETLKENLLFAKMYCYCLANEIEFYKDIKFATNKLNDELIKSIDIHYLKISNELNRIELNNFCSSVGIVTDHFEKSLMTDIQETEQQTKIKTNQLQLQKFVLGTWSVESVYKALNNTITELINKHKNKK